MPRGSSLEPKRPHSRTGPGHKDQLPGQRAPGVALASGSWVGIRQQCHPDLLQLSRLGSFQTLQQRFPPPPHHEHGGQRGQQHQAVLPSPRQKQQERCCNDQQRVQKYRRQGGPRPHARTQNPHTIHKVPDPTGGIQDVGSNEQRRARSGGRWPSQSTSTDQAVPLIGMLSQLKPNPKTNQLQPAASRLWSLSWSPCWTTATARNSRLARVIQSFGWRSLLITRSNLRLG